MNTKKIEFHGSLEDIDFLEKALKELPDSIIKYKNSNLIVSENLKVERSTIFVSVYPTSEVSSILPPGEAKNVGIYLQKRYTSFIYEDKSFLVHFDKKEK